MYWYGDHMGAWGWAVMVIGTVAFWALIITGIILLVRYVGHSTQTPPEQPPATRAPEQLLAERFARGEIDEAEYRHRLDILRGVTRA